MLRFAKHSIYDLTVIRTCYAGIKNTLSKNLLRAKISRYHLILWDVSHLIYAYIGAHRRGLISFSPFFPIIAYSGYRATFAYFSDALSPAAHSLAEGDTLLLPWSNRLILSQNNIFVNPRAQNKIIDTGV